MVTGVGQVTREGTFACAVLANDTKCLALLNFEIDVAEKVIGCQLSVVGTEIVCFSVFRK
jgi:hypothetical protein